MKSVCEKNSETYIYIFPMPVIYASQRCIVPFQQNYSFQIIKSFRVFDRNIFQLSIFYRRSEVALAQKAAELSAQESEVAKNGVNLLSFSTLSFYLFQVCVATSFAFNVLFDGRLAL